MRILRDLRPPSSGGWALVVGNFDGFHLGHRALIEAAKEAAREEDLLVAAATFEPHPLDYFSRIKNNKISSLREKLAFFSNADLAAAFVLRFSRRLASATAEDFAERVFAAARAVAVGENFRFGKNRVGDVDLLRKTASRRGGRVIILPLVREPESGARISSGAIRDLLAAGDFARAATFLGREWEIVTRVGRGAGLGAKLGFPTANLRLKNPPPCRGVFAARAVLEDGAGGSRRLAAAVSIGKNPTVRDSDSIKVEAHLLDFSGDIYGRRLRLIPIAKLRDERKYGGLTELRKAIAADTARCREMTAAGV